MSKKINAKKGAKPIEKATDSTHTGNNQAEAKEKTNKANHQWMDFLDSSLVEKTQSYFQNLVNFANNSSCTSTKFNNDLGEEFKQMLTKLSANLQHNFEENISLGREALNCKTAADFIEFQRKHFELNYKNTVRTYSDFSHDMQHFAKQTVKQFNKYNQLNANGFVS